MVNLVEDWSDLEEYAKWCRYGAYQTRDGVDGIEVRVRVGQFGYFEIFKEEQDQQLKRILKFCESEGFIKVSGNIPDELFFTS
mgnify:CR=1 FL=1